MVHTLSMSAYDRGNGKGFSCQGNLLTGSAVVEEIVAAFINARRGLSRRLLAALHVSTEAGGDRCGKEVAALLVVREQAGYLGPGDRLVSMRVDDHREPLEGLSCLIELHEVYRGKTPEERKLLLDGRLLKGLQHLLKAYGLYTAEPDGSSTDGLSSAPADYVNNENLEHRIGLERRTIDPPVLKYIRQHHGF